jgi:hypothetical protein
MTRYYSATAVDNTIASPITSGATSVTLSATPVGYPASGNPFVLALDYNTSSEELVLVTSYAGATLTITRAFNGSSAQAHSAGALVRHVIVAQDLTDTQTHYNTALSAGVHGVTGSLATFLGTPTSANLAATISDETGTGSLVFGTAPKIALGINAQTGTTYTLVAGDAANFVTCSNAGGITVTIPAAVFSAGQQISVQQTGAGQVTFANDGTSSFTGTGTKLRAQYSAATIVCITSSTFTIVGDIV